MKETRYQKVADRILNLIHNGVLKEGDKIPSIRQLSSELNVSVNTIKEAYWKLEARNYIVAVPQSGFYVKKQALECRENVIDPRHLNPQDVSICRVYGAFLHTGRCRPESSLGIATLDPELWPTKRMATFFKKAIKDHPYES